MKIMKELLQENGVDLEEIRKEFFASGDDCEKSIKDSRSYIVIMCKRKKKSMWDFVRDEMTDIEKDEGFTEYQKAMTKTSLLLAWEYLEKNDEQLCFDIHRNALN